MALAHAGFARYFVTVGDDVAAEANPKESSSEEPPKRKERGSFWRTLPGILTAIGGILAALAPIIVVVIQLRGSGQGGDAEPITVTVPGARIWTDTGVDLKMGDRVSITADGFVFHNEKESVNADGDPRRFESNVLATANHAELIGRLGPQGEPFAVGMEANFTAPGNGRLYLGVNDKGFENNSGRFKAFIKVTRDR